MTRQFRRRPREAVALDRPAQLDDPGFLAWRRALAATALSTGIPPFALAQADFGKHGGENARARDLAIYLLAVEGDLGFSAAARVVGVSKQAVHKLVRRVEDSRAAPEADALLSRAEALMRDFGGAA